MKRFCHVLRPGRTGALPGEPVSTSPLVPFAHAGLRAGAPGRRAVRLPPLRPLGATPPRRPPAEPRTVTPRGDLTRTGEDEHRPLQAGPAERRPHHHADEPRPTALNLNVQQVPEGTGSGFIWDDSRATSSPISTSSSGADAARSRSPTRRPTPPGLVGVAPDKDLAVLQINAPAVKADADRRRHAATTCRSARWSSPSATPSASTRR